jgi:hypothetical protein
MEELVCSELLLIIRGLRIYDGLTFTISYLGEESFSSIFILEGVSTCIGAVTIYRPYF